MPEESLVGNIIPIYTNKYYINYVNNYKGITLLSCMCKVFIYKLNNKLTVYCDDKNLINESQSGFRKSYSIVDHIFVLICLVERQINFLLVHCLEKSI